ncbi:unnamed protein product [Notodromas monacha]|uniref:PX domain-containing protein n=1 Tax=Notodromas monacha TaxID=399045 RepID=A0A7R9BQ48_9CRUS|nr:unnamed protein product [Notodromas monacha]CAG0919383.1 unnamed protein product [Notodromas monacha]
MASVKDGCVSPCVADDASANASLVQSPSMGSISSSVFNSLRFDDDDPSVDASSDFYVKVDNPEKHVTTMETFITFRVTLRTTRPEFNNSEYHVRRRYNDFKWLRNRLEAENPSRVIPPVPEKHNLKEQLDRYGREFILQRMFLLNKFLQRLADHPVLSYDQNLVAFLTSSPAEFACHKKRREGLFVRVSTSMQNMSSLSVYLIKPQAPEFDQIGAYIGKFGEKLNFVGRVGSRIHQERTYYARELKMLAPALLLWANCESKLKQTLEILASAVDTSAKANDGLLHSHNFKFHLPLREYELWVDAVKSSLKRRDHFQVAYELSVEDLERKRADKVSLSSGGGENLFSFFSGKDSPALRLVREQKLDNTIEAVKKDSGEKGDRSEMANADIRADFERWTSMKDADLRSILLSHAIRHVQVYEQCVAAWENALSRLSDH